MPRAPLPVRLSDSVAPASAFKPAIHEFRLRYPVLTTVGSYSSDSCVFSPRVLTRTSDKGRRSFDCVVPLAPACVVNTAASHRDPVSECHSTFAFQFFRTETVHGLGGRLVDWFTTTGIYY